MARDQTATAARIAISRRALIVYGGSAVVAPLIAAAQESAPTPAEAPSAAFEKAWKAIVLDGQPSEERITLELPEIAENGNFVPVTISVDSPMTDDDHVRKLHILSTSNPQPVVATFHLSPLNGRAVVQSRMRLARTQDVIALAETSKGDLLLARVLVKVTIGGCSN